MATASAAQSGDSPATATTSRQSIRRAVLFSAICLFVGRCFDTIIVPPRQHELAVIRANQTGVSKKGFALFLANLNGKRVDIFARFAAYLSNSLNRITQTVGA